MPICATAAADKTYQDDALDEAAITLAADLKNESGTVELPVGKLKELAAVELRKQNLGAAAFIYGQIVSVAPDDAEAWRRLADIWLAIPPDENDDGTARYQNARTAAYIAYRLAKTPAGEAAVRGSQIDRTITARCRVSATTPRGRA